jgi:DNA-binding CsgD family transcriptional regulator
VLLRQAVEHVAAGQGGLALVEGEPGIGKSALLTEGLAGAATLGCQIGWASADELSQRLPLRLMLECLDVEPGSADPRRAEIARLLRPEAGGRLLATGDPMLALSERLLALVDQLCSAAPLVLVGDDMQWVDDTSLLVWHRLVRMVEQLPLLLVAAVRPVPRRDGVDQLIREVTARGGLVISLGPLSPDEVTEMVTGLVGAPPGPRLRALADRAAGNPLYVGEMIETLVRDTAVAVDARRAELIGESAERIPTSLAAAIAGRLAWLSPEATAALCAATLLGNGFSVDDLAVVLQQTPIELADRLAEANAAGVVAASDDRLSFRHPLIRHALYDGMPGAVRAALHRHAAQALAESGAPAEQVAGQLLAAPTGIDTWVASWLAKTSPALSDRAPEMAVELLQRFVTQMPADGPRWDDLAAGLARVLFRIGRNAQDPARQVLARTNDAHLAAEMRWILGEQLHVGRRIDDALAIVSDGLGDPALPTVWRARLRAMTARIHASGTDLDAAEAIGQESLAFAEQTGDRLAISYCLLSLSTIKVFRRDGAARLAYLDRALEAIGDDLRYLDLRLLLLGNRAFALLLIECFADAEATLQEARDLAERRSGYAGLARIHLPAANVYYMTGRWDDALAEIDAASDLPENPRHAMMVAGIVALIACHRDDRATAVAQVRAAGDRQLTTPFEVANGTLLLTARSRIAERDGRPDEALSTLKVILEPRFAPMERHLRLPDLVRLAMTVSDLETARAAVELCEFEAAERPIPGRLAAVAWSRGLLTQDPVPLREAADHLREVGRVFDLARTLEDIAVLLAERGDKAGARASIVEATKVYTELGAHWDLRRADARLRVYGIRRGARGPRQRSAHGWDALSPTELTIARMVSQGRSNPDIAAELLLSRRTVQSHVSNILAKLGAHSRIEIARESIRHR